MSRMTQWHPIFAQLLRPAVEAYYEVQTTVPVGDAPREADFVLLRRTAAAAPPFRGLWRHLTTWNILEFKGPSVVPRRGDIDLLVELGLGINRRLQAPRMRQRCRRYLARKCPFGISPTDWGRAFCRMRHRRWPAWSCSAQACGAAGRWDIWYCWSAASI